MKPLIMFYHAPLWNLQSIGQALQELQKNLKSINTPPDVVDAVAHRWQLWICRQTDPDIAAHALTAGSLRGHEQFYTIGWQHMLHGRLSKLWG